VESSPPDRVWIELGIWLSMLVWAIAQMRRPQPSKPKRTEETIRRETRLSLICAGAAVIPLECGIAYIWIKGGWGDSQTALTLLGGVAVIGVLVAAAILLSQALERRRLSRH
jgi:hypothetical protein